MRIPVIGIATVLATLISSSIAFASALLPPALDGRASLLDLTGPGHPPSIGAPGDPKARARIVAIVMSDDMRYAPKQIMVSRGEAVRLEVQNNGVLKHEFVLGTWDSLAEHAELMQKFPEMEHDDPNGLSVPPGKSQTLVWKFTKAGTFFYGCLHPGHFEAGMVGKIIVR